MPADTNNEAPAVVVVEQSGPGPLLSGSEINSLISEYMSSIQIRGLDVTSIINDGRPITTTVDLPSRPMTASQQARQRETARSQVNSMTRRIINLPRGVRL